MEDKNANNKKEQKIVSIVQIGGGTHIHTHTRKHAINFNGINHIESIIECIMVLSNSI